MKRFLLFAALCALFLLPHKAHAQSIEACKTGACYGFGPPAGAAINGYIYQDVSQSPPALYCPKNGAWVACGSGATTVTALPGALADYRFTDATAAQLTDFSGNGNSGTPGSGSSVAPIPAGTGWSFGTAAGLQAGVQLPTALNAAKTIQIWFYANPTITTPRAGAYQLLVTSTLGTSGLNLLAISTYSNGVFKAGTYGLSTFVGTSNTTAYGVYSGFHSYTLVCGVNGSSVDHLYLDGVEVSYLAQGTSCGAQTSGNLVLGTTNASAWVNGYFNGTMYRALFYSTQLTPAQVLSNHWAVVGEIASRGVPVTPARQFVGRPAIHGIGDSIMVGLNISTPWISELSLTNQPSYVIKNWGVSGDPALEFATSEPNRVAPLCRSSELTPPIAIIHEGTNDFIMSGSPAMALDIWGYIAGHVQTLKDAGCRVFVATMLSRTGTGTNGSTMDVNKDALDMLILANAKAAGADGVIDFAANPLLGADGAYSNSTYFQGDATHPTQTGANLMATIASNTLNYFAGYAAASPHVLTASATLASGDRAVEVGTLAGNIALVMPDCTGPSGESYTISNPQSAHTVTIAGGITAQPINGLTSAITIPSNSTVTLRDIANPKAVSGCHWAM